MIKKFFQKKKLDTEPLTLLIAHDNRTSLHTRKTHSFAERLVSDKKYKVIYDQQVWKPKERTSVIETDRRERNMVKKADVVVRIVPASSKTGSSRNEGANREIRKTVLL